MNWLFNLKFALLKLWREIVDLWISLDSVLIIDLTSWLNLGNYRGVYNVKLFIIECLFKGLEVKIGDTHKCSYYGIHLTSNFNYIFVFWDSRF